MTTEPIWPSCSENTLAKGLFGSAGACGMSEKLCEMDANRFAQLYADSESYHAQKNEEELASG